MRSAVKQKINIYYAQEKKGNENKGGGGGEHEIGL